MFSNSYKDRFPDILDLDEGIEHFRPQIRIPRVFLINSAPKSAKSDGNPNISGNFSV